MGARLSASHVRRDDPAFLDRHPSSPMTPLARKSVRLAMVANRSESALTGFTGRGAACATAYFFFAFGAAASGDAPAPWSPSDMPINTPLTSAA